MAISGIRAVEAFRINHPDWNTPADEDIIWALKNFYVAYDSGTDLFTTTEMGKLKLMKTKGNC